MRGIRGERKSTGEAERRERGEAAGVRMHR